jgi:predicted nucleotidyltransferase
MTQGKATLFYQKQIERLVAILKHCQPKMIILFGSVAQGKAQRGSDIDLCIVKKFSGGRIEEKQNLRRLLSAYNYTYPVGIDFHLYSPAEFENGGKNFFIEEIKKTGKVIYE